jgi:HlyD family secretion protein
MPRPPASAPKAAVPVAADGTQTIWVLRSGTAVPMQVRVGATDGRVTEIIGGGLEAGMPVITEATSPRS